MAKPRNIRGIVDTSGITAGVVGLGLMGRSIVTCLLSSGHPVVGITGTKSNLKADGRLINHNEALVRVGRRRAA